MDRKNIVKVVIGTNGGIVAARFILGKVRSRKDEIADKDLAKMYEVVAERSKYWCETFIDNLQDEEDFSVTIRIEETPR